MNRLFWFGVGVLLILLLALCMGTAHAEGFDPKRATVADAMAAVDREDIVVVSWLTGLTQGAFMAYINKLVDGGMSGKVAVAVAESNCGDLSAQGALFAAYGERGMRDKPVIYAVPTLVWAYCTKKESAS